MRIEKEVLKFLGPINSLKISDLQKQYMSILTQGQSIESTVDFFLKQGWLVNFSELFDLLEKLVKEKMINNKNVVNYFEESEKVTSGIFDFLGIANSAKKTIAKPEAELPFFRSLNPQLRNLLLAKAYTLQLKPNTLICKANDTSRDLFVLTRGEAKVYRPTSANNHQLVATLDQGSVFGEAAFLLGQPRTASIVTIADCEILVVPYLPEVLDNKINLDAAKSLQHRFWLYHALQKSDFFNAIPSDCLDSLAGAGKPVEFKANETIFHQATAGNCAYVVIQGSILISQNNKNIAVMGQGDFLGEVALLATGGMRSATALAQNDCLLLEIKQSDFYRLLSQNLFLAKELETLAINRLTKDAHRK